MRRAPRLGAIVFENRIRELQTSVERTGVAAGPHPRAPGSPSQRAGRRRGRKTFGGGDLARRDLHTSDVVEKRAPVGSRGNAIHCQVERGPRTRSGTQKVATWWERSRIRAQCTSCERRCGALATRERDRHDRRRWCCNDSSTAPSPEEGRAAALDDEVTSETSLPMRSIASGNRSDSIKAREGASSWMGSGARQSHRDEGVRGRKRRQDAGWVRFDRTKTSLALHRARQKRERCGKPTTMVG